MEFVFRRTYRGELKAVILDWAGTTIDFGCFAPAGVFVEVFKSKNVEISIEEARAPMGMHKKDHIREIAKMNSVSKRWYDAHNKNWDEKDIEEMFEEFIPLQIGVLKNYSELVNETLTAQTEFRKRKMKIGTTTGYNNDMMKIIVEEAARQGYVPDSVVCATDVPYGRPAPWMAFKAAMDFNIYPMESYLKIGDTISDIQEGLNAGMWSIGVIMSSNEMGLKFQEINSLPEEVIERRKKEASARMLNAGAHYVINTLNDLPGLIDSINEKLKNGERP
jgi:phosphonoacetaldehyde hydrolase